MENVLTLIIFINLKIFYSNCRIIQKDFRIFENCKTFYKVFDPKMDDQNKPLKNYNCSNILISFQQDFDKV